MVLRYRVKRTVFTPAWPWQMQLSTGYQWPEHRHWTQSAAALEVFQWSNNHNTLLDFLVNCTFSRLLLLLEWYCTHMWKLPCKLSARIIIELWITFTSSEPQLLHSSCNQKAKNNKDYMSWTCSSRPTFHLYKMTCWRSLCMAGVAQAPVFDPQVLSWKVHSGSPAKTSWLWSLPDISFSRSIKKENA